MPDVMAYFTLDARFLQVRLREAGKHGDTEDCRCCSLVPSCFHRRFQHLASASRVHRQHVSPKCRGGFYCPGNGVGDVVQFEVEKDLSAGVHKLRNNPGSLRSE